MNKCKCTTMSILNTHTHTWMLIIVTVVVVNKVLQIVALDPLNCLHSKVRAYISCITGKGRAHSVLFFSRVNLKSSVF